MQNLEIYADDRDADVTEWHVKSIGYLYFDDYRNDGGWLIFTFHGQEVFSLVPPLSGLFGEKKKGALTLCPEVGDGNQVIESVTEFETLGLNNVDDEIERALNGIDDAVGDAIERLNPNPSKL